MCLSLLLEDDRGQDLIEYALLSAFIGVISVAVWGVIATRLGTAYTGFDTNTQGIWETPDPAGS
jgi:Flp pilus assembly pilin Flp